MRGRRVLAVAAAVCLLAVVAPDQANAADTDVVLSGRMAIDHADGFGAEGSVDYPTLEVDDERLTLVGVSADDVAPGVMVRVRGQREGSRFVVADGKAAITFDSFAERSADASPPMSRRVAVLLINFVGEAWTTPRPPPPTEPWTKPMVRSLYFDGAKSVAAYYSELSDGNLSVGGDVFGYFTLNVSTLRCDYNAWGAAARQAAANAGIDLSGYSNVVHAFTHQQACWWKGMAVVPGNKSWINGALTPYVATHELGHNLGVSHASSVSCFAGESRVAFSTTCKADEYGDPFDVMGYTAPRQMHSWHRYKLGFLTAAAIETVTDSGRYRVAPIEFEGDAPRIIRVRRSATDFFYVEFRRPHGLFDDFSPLDSAVNGVLIRLAPDVATTRSKLVDATPDTTSFSDAALPVGRTFTDPTQDISITLLSVSPTGAQIEVRFGHSSDPPTGAPQAAADATASAPSAVTRLRVKLTETDQAILDWEAPADDTRVDHYLVTSDGIPLARTRLTELDAMRVGHGLSYVLGVRAVDAAGSAGEEATAALVVPDVTPPARLQDFALTRSGASALMRWRTATDNIAVTGYKVFRDGVAVGSLGPEAVSYTDGPLATGRAYRYAVAALDAAGNLSVPGTGTFTLGSEDITPPSVPTDLAASSGGNRQVVLTWSASTDDRGGGVRYQVYRGARKVAVVSTITFTDRPARSGRYRYRVRAVDDSRNKSGFSPAVLGLAAP